jgi:uncharacterized membrane protein (DUF373 family)
MVALRTRQAREKDKRVDITSRKDIIVSKVEVAAVTAMQVLLLVIVAVSTVALCVLLAKNIISQLAGIESAAELLPKLQQSFGGVLTVVLGLELLETLKAYFTEHHVRLEVILVVAIIAVGRQVILLDFEHASGILLLGLSGVILALTSGYFLIKKVQAPLIQTGLVQARADSTTSSGSKFLVEH